MCRRIFLSARFYVLPPVFLVHVRFFIIKCPRSGFRQLYLIFIRPAWRNTGELAYSLPNPTCSDFLLPATAHEFPSNGTLAFGFGTRTGALHPSLPYDPTSESDITRIQRQVKMEVNANIRKITYNQLMYKFKILNFRLNKISTLI